MTSPQWLASMIVAKTVNMAEMMHIPIVSLVENMSYFTCPDNNKNHQIFGESHIEEIADTHNLKVIVGANGSAKAATEAYLQGSLESTGSICRDHQHHGECGD